MGIVDGEDVESNGWSHCDGCSGRQRHSSKGRMGNLRFLLRAGLGWDPAILFLDRLTNRRRIGAATVREWFLSGNLTAS